MHISLRPRSRRDLRARIDEDSRAASVYQEALEEGQQYLARTDPVTGLASIGRFTEHIEGAIARGCAEGRTTALMILDIDRFRVINDGCGLDQGDGVLRAVADRLRGFLRVADSAARLGGDDFGVAFSELDGPEQALSIATRIAEAMTEPIRVEDTDFRISVSIGICTCDDGAIDPELLLRRADVAMYEAKSKRCGPVRWTPYLSPHPSYIGLPTRPLFGRDEIAG